MSGYSCWHQDSWDTQDNFDKIDKGQQQRSSYLLDNFIVDPRISNLLTVETTTLKIILGLINYYLPSDLGLKI